MCDFAKYTLKHKGLCRNAGHHDLAASLSLDQEFFNAGTYRLKELQHICISCFLYVY